MRWMRRPESGAGEINKDFYRVPSVASLLSDGMVHELVRQDPSEGRDAPCDLSALWPPLVGTDASAVSEAGAISRGAGTSKNRSVGMWIGANLAPLSRARKALRAYQWDDFKSISITKPVPSTLPSY